MNLPPKRLLVITLFLGWLFDFFFWKQAPVLNFALFALLSVFAGLALLISAGRRPARTTLLLLVPFAFFALMTFIRQEPLTSFVNYLLTLLLMSLVAVTYLGGCWWEYSFLDYLRNFLRLVGSLFFRPWGWIGQLRRAPTESPVTNRRWLWPLVRGLLLALPVVVVFASFVLIQFQYFFSRSANIHLDGFTYSEYARRGFGALVAVAFFSLLLLFVLAAISRRQNELQRPRILCPGE
ncbi:MAG: DUF4153 domain-containing protein [Anaerolineae bacterium]